jgi:hypothetical protein
VKREDHPSPFGEQVVAAVGELSQLGDRGIDVEWLPAGVAALRCRRSGRA